jgi:phosphatidylinositol glycan class N
LLTDLCRDEGSWLEIGSTISHFCIASLLCLFVAGLEGVSEWLITGVEVSFGSQSEQHATGVVTNNLNGMGAITRKPVANGQHSS